MAKIFLSITYATFNLHLNISTDTRRFYGQNLSSQVSYKVTWSVGRSDGWLVLRLFNRTFYLHRLQLKSMWKEVVMTYFKVLAQHFLGRKTS
jgi:hypothetical protein